MGPIAIAIDTEAEEAALAVGQRAVVGGVAGTIRSREAIRQRLGLGH